jgi:hypothetical protein
MKLITERTVTLATALLCLVACIPHDYKGLSYQNKTHHEPDIYVADGNWYLRLRDDTVGPSLLRVSASVRNGSNMFFLGWCAGIASGSPQVYLYSVDEYRIKMKNTNFCNFFWINPDGTTTNLNIIKGERQSKWPRLWNLGQWSSGGSDEADLIERGKEGKGSKEGKPLDGKKAFRDECVMGQSFGRITKELQQ